MSIELNDYETGPMQLDWNEVDKEWTAIYKERKLSIRLAPSFEYEGFVDNVSVSRGQDDRTFIEQELINHVDGKVKQKTATWPFPTQSVIVTPISGEKK